MYILCRGNCIAEFSGVFLCSSKSKKTGEEQKKILTLFKISDIIE